MMEDGTHWLEATFFLMPTWKWIVLVVVAGGGYFVCSFLRFAIAKMKTIKTPNARDNSFWHYYSDLSIEGPAAWILVTLIWIFAIDALALPPTFAKYAGLLVKVILALNIVRLVYIAMDAVGSLLSDYTGKTPSTLDDHLAPLAVKSAKVLVIILGILITLQNFGVEVMSLMAGLGIGGLAIALAAQDAVANLIGSIMIILDRPFSIGDSVKVANVEGTIEAIGFRSTRIRTGYNSLISVPNSVVAKETIDNMGVRPFRRVKQILGLHYDTPPALIEKFCDRVREIIAADETSVKNTIQVSFTQFADSSLNIQVIFHLEIFDANEELERTQKIFCNIIEAAKKMDVAFAYPTQTVYYMQGADMKDSALHKVDTLTSPN
ncbi:MAG: mechanosensitive ion channel family protein [Bdellovibrionaceae bacterium]|nr:mechanosensitive ion channel family protein [Pseudobdellovibrionaceae bacterium]